MASWRDFLEEEGYENLSEAKKLTDICAKDDPEDDPYRSLYKARDCYKDVSKVLKKWADKRKVEDDLKFLAAALELRLGENYASCEEMSTGEEHLQKCLERIEDYKLTKEGGGIYQEVMNQLGILSSARHRPEAACEFFAQSEALYNDYKSIVGGAPMAADEWLGKPSTDLDALETKRSKKLEDNYTLTLYYFAQVYQTLREFSISAQYCHLTLQRQLETNDYDALDWALSCATLSQYYIRERDFTMGRHCLASADFIFEQAEAKLSECSEDKKEKVLQGKADIRRCWVKYCLNLMEHSRDELVMEASQANEPVRPDTDSRSSRTDSDVALPELTPDSGSVTSEHNVSPTADTDNKTPEQEQAETEGTHNVEENPEDGNGDASNVGNDGDTSEQVETNQENTADGEENKNAENSNEDGEVKKVHQRPKLIVEPRFNLEVSSREEKVTDKAFKTFDEARVIFLLIKKQIENTKEFYKLDEHCPDYVSIVQDHSLSFKHLSFFELDLERQCKMQKRRIDMLTEVLNELSLQHYLLVCRQLMYEVAETYSAMMDLKTAILEAAGPGVRPTPHNVRKLNTLATEAIKYFQEYLNTLKGGKPVYPDEFPQNDVRPGLVAMFYLGRLHSKIITGDVQSRLLNIKKSKDCYQFLVDYCKRNRSAAELIEAELDICKEMVLLLPKKMEKIRMESEI